MAHDLRGTQQLTLGAFLKGLRTRIHSEARTLGTHERLPCRWGKPVTQDELSEAAGVTRIWYCRLESDARIRASTRVLSRIADALMLTAEERFRLFQLGIPEVQPV